MFQRAADYLSNQQGYDTGRLLVLADRYGYEAFANLAPPAAGRPGGGKTKPTDPGAPRQPSPQKAGVRSWPSVVLAKYQENEGLGSQQVFRLGDALKHVDIGEPRLAEVIEDVGSDLAQGLYRTKHWLAVLGALSVDEQDWSQRQDLRRRKLITRVLEVLRAKPDELTGTGTVDGNEVTSAHDAVRREAKRLAPAQLGQWLAESVSVEPSQATFAQTADWIEWESPRADYFW